MDYLLVFFLTISDMIYIIGIITMIVFEKGRKNKMLGKFSLRLEVRLRDKVKSEAALNQYESMNALIVEAIEEKIQSIEMRKVDATKEKKSS